MTLHHAYITLSNYGWLISEPNSIPSKIRLTYGPAEPVDITSLRDWFGKTLSPTDLEIETAISTLEKYRAGK